MNQLDDVELLRKLDQVGLGHAIEELPDQVESGFDTITRLALPASLIQINQIVICAVGDPVVAAKIAVLISKSESKVSVILSNDYILPESVNSKTLVIALSYSGNSDEVVTQVKAAVAKGAKIIAISTGGELGSLSRQHKFMFIPIEYGAEGRGAIGIIVALLLGLLNKIDIADLPTQVQSETVLSLQQGRERLKPDVNLQHNLAKQVVDSIGNKQLIVISYGTMMPVADRFRLNINQNLRKPVIVGEIPDFSHNGLSGLENIQNPDNYFVILLGSLKDHPRLQVHMNTCRSIIKSTGIPSLTLEIPQAIHQITEIMLGIQLVDYICYYLNLSYGQPIQNLEVASRLKENLSKLRQEGKDESSRH